MSSGVIVDIVKVSPIRWWVNCVGTGSESSMTCAIYLDPKGSPVDVGDSLWWHGSFAYWTPAETTKTETRAAVGRLVRKKPLKDVKLPKLSFSGVAHPDTVKKDKG